MVEKFSMENPFLHKTQALKGTSLGEVLSQLREKFGENLTSLGEKLWRILLFDKEEFLYR